LTEHPAAARQSSVTFIHAHYVTITAVSDDSSPAAFAEPATGPSPARPVGLGEGSVTAATAATSSSAAAATAAPIVGPASHLTLHYRLTIADTGADVINTFEGKPATLQLGIGQMAEPLEGRLQGLPEGVARVFDLAPTEAFGLRNPELVQRVSRAMLASHSEPGTRYVPGDLLEFPGPDGDRFAGVVKEVDERGALLDFNHPLAGQRIRFEVRILGIL
jgi:FKBP-type peptidyl-prolyl cis-trans isomerase SlpA